MTLSDIAIILGLILLIPKLVEKYLLRLGFSNKMRMMVILGGFVWIIFSCCFGITGSDASAFEQWGQGQASLMLEKGDYTNFLNNLLSGGNTSYSFYQGFIYYVSSATVISILAINAFMAFWGTLTLVRTVYSGNSIVVSKGIVLPLFLIFTPSVVYWSSANLKEALLYWAVCQILAFVPPQESRKQVFYSFGLFLIGGFIGMLLRPHTALIWFVAVFMRKMIRPRFWKYGICIILFVFAYNTHIYKIELHVNFGSLEETISKAEDQMGVLVRRGKPSTFDYGEGGPIPVISGAVNAFFRPFIWHSHKLTALLSSLEIWTISLGILFLWGRMTKSEWKSILRNPIIQITILVLIPFSFLFMYFPNEGLLARQRVQLFPALLALFATPILLRQRVGCMEHGAESIEHGAKGKGGLRAEGGGRRSEDGRQESEVRG